MVDKKKGYKPNYRRLYEDQVRKALQEELKRVQAMLNKYQEQFEARLPTVQNG